jgi:hypothetical protein
MSLPEEVTFGDVIVYADDGDRLIVMFIGPTAIGFRGLVLYDERRGHAPLIDKIGEGPRIWHLSDSVHWRCLLPGE